MARSVAHANRSAPVVHDQGNIPVRTDLLQQRVQIVDSLLKPIAVLLIGGFVRQAAADMVRNDDAMGSLEGPDKLTIDE